MLCFQEKFLSILFDILKLKKITEQIKFNAHHKITAISPKSSSPAITHISQI